MIKDTYAWDFLPYLWLIFHHRSMLRPRQKKGFSSFTNKVRNAPSIRSSVADPDVYPGSRIRLFSIPDPNCLHPGSRIRIKEFKYFNPKKPKKWFLSSRKYDPGCSSRIPDPDADFLPISDPGSKDHKGTGSRIRIRITDSNLSYPVYFL